MDGLRTAAHTHLGHANSRGHAFRLLDDSVYSNVGDELGYEGVVSKLTPGHLTRYVVRSAVAFLVVPLPWDVVSWSELILVPQQVVWYLMVPLAMVGVVAGFRRDPLVTLLLVSCIVVAAVPISLSNGNIGTLVRHRDTVVPFVVWLSGLGVVCLAGWLTSRHRLSPDDVSAQAEGPQ